LHVAVLAAAGSLYCLRLAKLLGLVALCHPVCLPEGILLPAVQPLRFHAVPGDRPGDCAIFYAIRYLRVCSPLFA